MSERPRERTLLDDLPRVYRRDGGRILERYLDLAESLVDPLRSDIVELTTAEAPDLLERVGLESLEVARVESVATARELTLRLARSRATSALPPPLVWPGRVLEGTDAGELVVRQPSHGRAVVIAWTRKDVPAIPDDLDLRDDDLPCGIAMQAVLVDASPGRGVPVPGMLLRGVVFWSRGVAEPAVESDSGIMNGS